MRNLTHTFKKKNHFLWFTTMTVIKDQILKTIFVKQNSKRFLGFPCPLQITAGFSNIGFLWVWIWSSCWQGSQRVAASELTKPRAICCQHPATCLLQGVRKATSLLYLHCRDPLVPLQIAFPLRGVEAEDERGGVAPFPFSFRNVILSQCWPLLTPQNLRPPPAAHVNLSSALNRWPNNSLSGLEEEEEPRGPPAEEGGHFQAWLSYSWRLRSHTKTPTDTRPHLRCQVSWAVKKGQRDRQQGGV